MRTHIQPRLPRPRNTLPNKLKLLVRPNNRHPPRRLKINLLRNTTLTNETRKLCSRVFFDLDLSDRVSNSVFFDVGFELERAFSCEMTAVPPCRREPL